VAGAMSLRVVPRRFDVAVPHVRTRDLEVTVPKEHEGEKIAQRFVDKLKERFGVPKAAQ